MITTTWRSSPYRIGLVALALCALMSAAVVWMSRASIGETTYSAQVAQTAGLRAGEDVTIAGVPVGTVKSIELAGRYVVVHFTVGSKHALGSATTADVRVATLLGTHYLAVDPHGSGSLPNKTIPLAQTSVPFNLQDVVNRGTGAIEALNGPLLAQALSAAADVTDSASGNIRPALQGIARMSQVISTRTDQAGALLQAAQSVTKQLNSSSANVFALMRQSSLVLNEITARRAQIHTLLVATAQLSRSLSTLIGRTHQDLPRLLSNTNVVLAMLKSQDATLKRALVEMAPTARYLANVAGNGPWIDVNIPNFAPDGVLCKAKGTC